MSIGKIIVPVTGANRDAAALAGAFTAAKPFNAHVVAMIVHRSPVFGAVHGRAAVAAGCAECRGCRLGFL
jgi:hypothetical protein